MAGKDQSGNAVPLSDLATAILDPVLSKRAGMTTALVQSWEEIVGETLATRSRPERIAWPRRADEDDPFEPATLVVACEGAMALLLQHSTGEIVARANAFLGFAAIGRVRIVQKPVDTAPPAPRPAPRPLGAAEGERLAAIVAPVEDETLRAALEKLGRSVIGTRR